MASATAKDAKCDVIIPTCCNPCLVSPLPAEPKKLHRCMGCKLVQYCSKEHQTLDWPMHKALCKAINALLTKYKINHILDISGPITSNEGLDIAILKVKFDLNFIMQRSLTFVENHLISFPVMCEICFSTNYSKLYCCKTCKGVSYCSQEHETKDAPYHKETCNFYKLYNCIYKGEPGANFEVQDNNTECDLLKVNLLTAVSLKTGLTVPLDPTESLSDYQRFSFIMNYSYVATLCYFMQHLNMNAYRGDTFTIWIIGATCDYIYFGREHLQFFFAFFPKLTRLNLIFVGPELSPDLRKRSEFNMPNGRTVLREAIKKPVEDYCTGNKFIHPNMVASFNCGFGEIHNEFNPWLCGISVLLDLPNLPVMFTSYSNWEADFDLDTVNKALDMRSAHSLTTVTLDPIMRKHLNPFRDLRPFLSWQFTDNERIFFRNNFIQGVRVSWNPS